LLEQLGDDVLRSIAVWKMEGLTNQEIAARLGCAVPTVERRLRLIRKTWSAEVGEDSLQD
jgi:DNA-directed RNA polymerase specialized sigma24 family protein